MQIIKEMEYPQFLRGESKLWWNYLVSKKGAAYVAGALASYISSADNKKFNTFLKDLFLKVKQGEDNAKKARDAKRDNDLLGDDEDLVEVTEDDVQGEIDKAAMEDLLAQGEQFWDENGDAIRKGILTWWNKMSPVEKCNVIAKYRVETSHFAKTATFYTPSSSAGKQILTYAGIPNHQGFPTVFREMEKYCCGKLYNSDDPYDQQLSAKMDSARESFSEKYGQAFTEVIIQQLTPPAIA